jgi:hypothetical protein
MFENHGLQWHCNAFAARFTTGCVGEIERRPNFGAAEKIATVGPSFDTLLTLGRECVQQTAFVRQLFLDEETVHCGKKVDSRS